MKNFKNILIQIYNWIFGKKKDNNIGIEYPIDLGLAIENDEKISNELLVLINKYRSENGMSIVNKGNAFSYAYSVQHTKYMIEQKKTSHYEFGNRNEGLKYRGAIRVGEIVAYGYKSAEDVLNAWLKSPTHKDIIDGDYNYTGFGIIKDQKGVYYFTELFYYQ